MPGYPKRHYLTPAPFDLECRRMLEAERLTNYVVIAAAVEIGMEEVESLDLHWVQPNFF